MSVNYSLSPLLSTLSDWVRLNHLIVAQTANHSITAGNVRGPMHGIPILIKDNVATLGMNLSTTAGSFALFGSTVPRDAHIIKLLREAGAISSFFWLFSLFETQSSDFSENCSHR
jgi:amidase